MNFTFNWPAPNNTAWTPESALSLIGQKVRVNDRPGKVKECELTDLGSLTVIIEMEDENESFGHPI
jgi:hypothetical protein